MKRFALFVGLLLLATHALAQVDVEHRRVLTAQAGTCAAGGDEWPAVYGYCWCHEVSLALEKKF